MVSPSDVLIFQTPVRVTLTTVTKKKKKKKEKKERKKRKDKIIHHFFIIFFVTNESKIFSSVNANQEEKWTRAGRYGRIKKKKILNLEFQT